MAVPSSVPLPDVAVIIDGLQVKRHLAEGSNVLEADANNWHALHEAARGGHLEVLG